MPLRRQTEIAAEAILRHCSVGVGDFCGRFMHQGSTVFRRAFIGVMAVFLVVIIAATRPPTEQYLASHPYLHAEPCPFCGRGPIVSFRYQEFLYSAFPDYNRSTAAKNACVANLKQIDGAVQQWALENRKSGKAPVTTSDVLEYLKGSVLPMCPQGGTYQVTTPDQLPICTINGQTCPRHSLEPEKFR
jgi:hypothetical protein